MKRSNVLWLAAAMVVVLYLALSYKSVQAQQQPTTVRIHEMNPLGGGVATKQIPGRIIGFSCVYTTSNRSECYVATTD